MEIKQLYIVQIGISLEGQVLMPNSKAFITLNLQRIILRVTPHIKTLKQ